MSKKKKKKRGDIASAAATLTLASALTERVQGKTVVKASLAGTEANALIDTGSLGSSFISKALVVKLKLDMKTTSTIVSMAEPTLAVGVKGCVTTDLSVGGTHYQNAKLLVLNSLCTDIIIGTDILGKHKQVIVEFGGDEPPNLQFCYEHSSCSSTMNIEPPSVFPHITPDCKPVAAKSRRYSQEDREYI